MSIAVDVSRMSGRTVSVEANLDSFVQALKRTAETALGVFKGQLLDSSGGVLNEQSTFKKLKLQRRASLTLHLRQVEVCGTKILGRGVPCSFAAALGDGSVVAWGKAATGGDCSAVQSQLKNVQWIQSNIRAFAAILGDRSVVTWGDAACGGDCSAVRNQLKNVRQIQSTAGAFAAIVGEGYVVTWGKADFGGHISAVQSQLTNVQKIQSTLAAFAAILGDGSLGWRLISNPLYLPLLRYWRMDPS